MKMIVTQETQNSLSDKISIYGTNPSFDRHIDGFWILGKDN